jgi:hypothetical protein
MYKEFFCRLLLFSSFCLQLTAMVDQFTFTMFHFRRCPSDYNIEMFKMFCTQKKDITADVFLSIFMTDEKFCA